MSRAVSAAVNVYGSRRGSTGAPESPSQLVARFICAGPFSRYLHADAPPPFLAKLTRIEGKKAEVGSEPQARAIEAALKSGAFMVEAVARKEKKQIAPAPFITSTLQRTAYNRFKYPVKRTMQIAQKLYEGKELGSFGQVGGLAAWSRLAPNASRLNPADGLKRMFSTRNLVNLLKPC